MTLRQQYNMLTAMLCVWERHESLVYDCIWETRQKLRNILRSVVN